MNASDPCNVLFLCTGNSARSIMAEAVLRHEGAGRFNAYSAGSQPTGRVNPWAIAQLAAIGLPTTGLRSKSWEEFAAPGAPRLDFIFTVCDNAAGEACPIWPGQPITAHWGVPDPAAVAGSDDDQRRAFADACNALAERIRQFVSLSLDPSDRTSLESKLAEIGRTTQPRPA
jgi:arsenate reductase (thioredoxin)